MHDESSFVTLTYDPKFLPKDGSLSVETCQLFLKRLRERLRPKRIRFFLCGEYGERLGRPHYHAIIFGEDFSVDRVQLEKRGEHALYSSRLLSDVWGAGFASIGAVTFESACYVANYATKKIVGKAAADHYKGLKPEFLLMSRRPGIGRSWIEKFSSDVYPSDEVIVRGARARPPRYYDQYLEQKDPALLEQLKVKRELEADVLEDVVFKSGVVAVARSRNVVRLAVRGRIAEAKLRLKSRALEREL